MEDSTSMTEEKRRGPTAVVESTRRSPALSESLFVELVLPVLDDLYRVACRLEGDRDRAQDLLQEGLLVAYRKLDQLEELRSFRVWTVQILRRVFLNSRRRIRDEEPLDEIESPAVRSFFSAPALDPEERFAARRRASELRELLDGLPRKQRLAVLLVDLQGFTYAEAAAALEVPAGTVASRVVRGRTALRAGLRRTMAKGGWSG